MADPMDIIPVPGQPGHYGRRALVDALVRAGNPPLNDSLRLTDKQQQAWEAYQAGTGSPADNPARPDLYPLAHVRGVAADITPTPARVAALEAQGLVRPYRYEPWHWQLPGNVRIYPLVTSIPASSDSQPFDPAILLEASMSNPIVNVVTKYGEPVTNGTLWIGRDDGTFERYDPPYDPNPRGVVGKVFYGGATEPPTINQRDFQTVQRIWKTMRKAGA